MRLPDGFRVELVASEPLVQDPTCIAFDARGRLFVCELHGYNLEGHLDVLELNETGVLDTQVRRIRWERLGGRIAEQAKKNQFGTVKLLTDTDGDGRMDTVDVWADRLPPCYGLVAARDGVIVVCAPDIVYLADRDGDGTAEVRETLYTGFRTDVLERGINNPRWGIDNWIYVGAGGHGGEIRGPGLGQPVQLGHSDFRIKADGSAIEPVTGTVGTFGLTQNDFGDRFPSSGGRPAMYALPLPHRYLRRNPYVATPATTHAAADYSRGYRISAPHPWRVRRREDPAWVKFYGNRETDSSYFTGGCGGEIYRAEIFPPSYRGNFFFCEPSLNIVHRCILERDGAGYRARRAAEEERSEFLASTDQWFRPINLRVGPEGALYVVDMYREIIEDYSAIPRFLQQQYGLAKGNDKGRIWRLRSDSPAASNRNTLAEASTDALVRAIADPNAWRRETAQRLLIERGDRAAKEALRAHIRGAATAPARVHALYTLHGLEELEKSDVLHALGDDSYGVRMHALQLAERWLNSDRAVLSRVISMTHDPDPRVRLQLAMSLGESQEPRAGSALVTLATHWGDQRWMSAAILSSVRESAGPMLDELLSASEPNPRAQTLLAPLAATLAGYRDGPQLARLLNDLKRHSESIQTDCLRGLLGGLSRGSDCIPESPDGWKPVRELLRSKSPRVQALAAKLGARLQLTEIPEMRAAFADAAEHAGDENRPIEQRQEAIDLLAAAPYRTLAPPATALLNPRHPPALQSAAVRALADSDDPRVASILIERWKGLTPKLRSEALAALLARQNCLPALLDALEDRVIRPGDVSALRREQLIKNQNERLAARAATLFENSAADAELEERLNRYQKALSGDRNTKRGKELFDKTCLDCHRMRNEGYEVGPDLGGVLNKPDEAVLIDMLDPSAHIESEYATYIVVTSSGITLTGILDSESATSVTLRKDKAVRETVLRTDIETIEASDVSLMPSNLHEQLTPQGAADLIAYLREALGATDPIPPNR